MSNTLDSLKKSLAAPPGFDPRLVPIDRRCIGQKPVPEALFCEDGLRAQFETSHMPRDYR